MLKEKKVKKYMVLGRNEYIDYDGSITAGPGPWYSDTLRGAKNLAARHMYWDNSRGWTKPVVWIWNEYQREYIREQDA